MFGSDTQNNMGLSEILRRGMGKRRMFPFVLSQHTAVLKTLFLWYIKLFSPHLGFSFLILLAFWLFWGIIYVSDVNCQCTHHSKRGEALDSPFQAINFCILKILSFLKEKLPIFISRDQYWRKINSQRTRELQGLWLFAENFAYMSLAGRTPSLSLNV